MYIRKSIRTYKGKTYTNYVLVESVQTPDGPRQKTICSLGDLSPRPRQQWLDLAHKLEHALAGQGSLWEGAGCRAIRNSTACSRKSAAGAPHRAAAARRRPPPP